MTDAVDSSIHRVIWIFDVVVGQRSSMGQLKNDGREYEDGPHILGQRALTEKNAE